MQIKYNAITAMVAAVLLAGGAVIGCTSTAGTQRTTGAFVDDAALTAKAKTALIKAENVAWNAINVETYNGVVSLSGFVDSDEMAQRAVKAVQAVEGVRSVKNDMHVKPQAAKQ